LIHFEILLQKKGKNATQAKKICDVYGHDAVSVHVVRSWFKRFQSRNFDVKIFYIKIFDVNNFDASRSGRLITGKVDEMMEKVEQDRHISSHNIDKELNIDYKTILNHLEKTEYKKNSIFGYHDLTFVSL